MDKQDLESGVTVTVPVYDAEGQYNGTLGRHHTGYLFRNRGILMNTGYYLVVQNDGLQIYDETLGRWSEIS